MKRLSKLEAVRGFAAVYVMLGHIFSDHSILFRFGQEAVILFFLLSGFVIMYSYSRGNDKSMRVFLLKRSLRIYVPLLTVFAVNAALYAFQGYRFTCDDAGTLLGNIFMLQDVAGLKPGVVCGTFLGNQPLWSLSYEWWFYIIFIVLAVKFGPCADKYVYPVSTVVALTYVLWPNFVSREVMYLTIWWLGADMARLYLRGKRIDMRNLRRGLAYMLAVICMLTMNAFVRGYTAIGVSPYLELRHFCFALVVVVAAVTWSRLRWIGFRQLFGPFEKIAGISFGIYISYWFLAVNTDYLAFIPNTGCRSVCGIAICVLFAYLIEKIIYPRVNSVVFSRLYRTK